MDPYEGIDVDAKDTLGYTALHKSCLIGDWEQFGELIKAGGDPRVRDDDGHDALWFAHLHLKAARAMAAQQFIKAGLVLNPCPVDLAGITDASAKNLGRTIYDRTLEAAGRPIKD